MKEKSFKVISELTPKFTLIEGDFLYLEIAGREGKFYKLADYEWPTAVREALKPKLSRLDTD